MQKRIRSYRTLLVALVLGLTAVSAAGAAFAGVAAAPGFEVGDGCIGVENLAGSSNIRVGIAVAAGHDGQYQATFDTLNGKVTGAGTVASGRGVIQVPIKQLGPYTNLVIVMLDSAQDVGLGPLAGKLPFVVGAGSIACDAATLTVPSSESASSSTSSSEASTTVPPTTGTTAPPAATATKQGATPLIWTLLIVLGLITAGAGVYVLFTPDPCAEERKRWEAARRECEAARGVAAESSRAFEQLRGAREVAQSALDTFRTVHPGAGVAEPGPARRGNLARGRAAAEGGASDAWREADVLEARAEHDRLETELGAATRDEEAAEVEARERAATADRLCGTVAGFEATYRQCVEAARAKLSPTSGVAAPPGTVGPQDKPPVRVGAAAEPASSVPPGLDSPIRDEPSS